MKFASIYLSNYIGIYNGMKLYEIHIDMTKCRNRITIIRGDNGSGKSTLSKAMTLFPDPNDSFIPGMSARKEIVLIDGEVIYKLTFIHGLKSNGDRDVTKAYITKTFNGVAVELNENGNVSSYKDILYSELGLDSNFIALSQLSNDDRGLADKKPAERKRFVNSIISSLETYNSIYKTLSKRASNYKSMINAVVGKLSVLGDEAALTASLESIEARINQIQDMKDSAIANLAKEQSTISILDPDGSIQQTNTSLASELSSITADIGKIDSIIASLLSSNNIPEGDYAREHRIITDRKNSLIVENQIARNTLDSLMSQKEQEADDLARKIQKLSSLQSGVSYEELVDSMTIYQAELDEIKTTLQNSVGFEDITSISKEEYILALETLRDLDSYISYFKSVTDMEVIDSIVTQYIKNGTIPDRVDIRSIKDRIDTIDDEINRSREDKAGLSSRISILDKLQFRPASCVDDSCEFIRDAIELSRNNPKAKIDQLTTLIESHIALKTDLEKDMAVVQDYNDAVNRFATIVREVDKNGAILSKMPNGEMFKNKTLFFERLLNGYSFEYMGEIYKYIDLANLFDTYKSTAQMYAECQAELQIYQNKAALIDELQSDIESIRLAVDKIMAQIEPINQEIFRRETEISKLQSLEAVYDAIEAQFAAKVPLLERSNACKNSLIESNRKMQDITDALNKSVGFRETINQCNSQLSPLLKERDKVNHSVQMMKDYIAERDELQANYEFIETIKYYSSPTTGIQLVFMELYMGKIIALANDLLGLLFSGQFVIQPFVINESEFRIPCLGSGYLNDDISSMSSSQIGMISMILSFALLHHSSTKYNIIKLDEIDGPLDYNNRVHFMDVLNSIMDIMGTEQCIMISHNSELQVDNSDVILLKHDTGNTDYLRGNIIWSY